MLQGCYFYPSCHSILGRGSLHWRWAQHQLSGLHSGRMQLSAYDLRAFCMICRYCWRGAEIRCNSTLSDFLLPDHKVEWSGNTEFKSSPQVCPCPRTEPPFGSLMPLPSSFLINAFMFQASGRGGKAVEIPSYRQHHTAATLVSIFRAKISADRMEWMWSSRWWHLRTYHCIELSQQHQKCYLVGDTLW